MTQVPMYRIAGRRCADRNWHHTGSGVWVDKDENAIIRGRRGWFGLLADGTTSKSFRLKATAAKWVVTHTTINPGEGP